ncbi:EAL domain-containing protein, partial [uncultured Sphingomonas sp.]|uniref:EAL domain-containing protein n=1 Tax=uncultured Sphingomonas sp. TaxID=158754 RepID=UPI002631829F
LMTDLEAGAAALAALQEAGCRTAIDDFGTGYSSLAYLAALPIDYLKLDRTLAQEIVGGQRSQVVVRAAIDMAASLGVAVVAEGVETAAQRDALAAAGCAIMQGFLLAPPLDAEGLIAMMEGRER